MFGGQIVELPAHFAQRRQMRRGTVMIAVLGGQPGFEKLDPPRVPAEHVRDLRLGQGDLCGQVRPPARADRGVDRQTVPDPGNALHHTVIGGADQIDLTELG